MSFSDWILESIRSSMSPIIRLGCWSVTDAVDGEGRTGRGVLPAFVSFP
jgi:hypothetical protein